MVSLLEDSELGPSLSSNIYPFDFDGAPGLVIGFGCMNILDSFANGFDDGHGPAAPYGIGFCSPHAGQAWAASGTSRVGVAIGDGDLESSAHAQGFNDGFYGFRYYSGQAGGEVSKLHRTYKGVLYESNGSRWIPIGSTGTFDTDNRAVTVLNNPPSSDYGLLGTLELGNSCQTKIGQFTLNSTTGNQAVSGLGFTDKGAGTAPDFVMFLVGYPLNVINAGNGGNWMVGVMDASGNQWVLNERTTFFSSIKRFSRMRTDACILNISAGGFGVDTTAAQLAHFVSMDSNGFTIDLTAAGLSTNGVASTVYYLAVKIDPGSGQIVVGHGAQSDTTVAAGFAPDAMMFFSNQAVDTTQNTTALATVGAIDQNNVQRCAWSGGLSDNPPPAIDSGYYYSSTGVITWADPLTQTLLAEASALLTGTGCSLDWTTDDAAGRIFGWVAFKIDGHGGGLYESTGGEWLRIVDVYNGSVGDLYESSGAGWIPISS